MVLSRILILAVCLIVAVAGELVQVQKIAEHNGRRFSVQGVELKNAAEPGTFMPTYGLGTGAYGSYYTNDSQVSDAVSKWLQLGGSRIDASLSYKDQVPVGVGIKQSGVPRSQIFVTSKVGPTDPLGYNDTLHQFQQILTTLNLDYVDLLLIHWPGQRPTSPTANSTDPACGPSGSPRLCRQSTWRALELIFREKKAKAIGVSNFEENHLMDIIEMNSLLPAVNQFEIHPYWHEDSLIQFCKSKNIVVNGYAPMGTPDVSMREFGWSLIENPVVTALAQKHQSTPGAILCRFTFQLGAVFNPRTKNPAHMSDSITNWQHIALSDADMAQLAALTNKNPKICPNPQTIP